MGCSRGYWYGALQKIYNVANTGSFTWSSIIEKYPDINKSVLSRLKCSGWIYKDKKPIMVNGKPKISKTVLWKLHPEAIILCKNGGIVEKNKLVKKTPTKSPKKCVCEIKTKK